MLKHFYSPGLVVQTRVKLCWSCLIAMESDECLSFQLSWGIFTPSSIPVLFQLDVFQIINSMKGVFYHRP